MYIHASFHMHPTFFQLLDSTQIYNYCDEAFSLVIVLVIISYSVIIRVQDCPKYDVNSTIHGSPLHQLLLPLRPHTYLNMHNEPFITYRS